MLTWTARPTRQAIAIALALVLPAMATSAVAQSTPDQEPLTLDGLQKQIDELKSDLEKRPMTGSSDVTMKIFGRIHLDSWTFTDSDDGINVFENGDPGDDPANNLEFRRARIGMSGDVHDDMLYKLEIDFGHPDDFAFKDMYFGFKDLGVLQTLLIGNQKRPYGLDHLNSSRFNVFIERPFIIEGVNQDARRLGVTSYGTTEDKAWNWRYGVYNGTDWAKTGGLFTDTLQPEVAGRLANTFWWEDDGRNYAHWAASGTIAFPDSSPNTGDAAFSGEFQTRPEARSSSRWLDTGVISDVDNHILAGLESATNFGPTQIVAEFMNTWVQRGGPSDDLVLPGGYVYVAHFLTGEHMPWVRKSGTLGRPKPFKNFGKSTGWGAWQVGARYSYADFSDEDIFGGEGHSLTMGLNWYWNPHASVQLNYIMGEISDRQEVVGPTTYTEGDYSVLGIRFRVDF
jgi:phosphate-selective porin OprO/OprP